MSIPEDQLIAKIAQLEQDDVDDLVDWQMASSPAALKEQGCVTSSCATSNYLGLSPDQRVQSNIFGSGLYSGLDESICGACDHPIGSHNADCRILIPTQAPTIGPSFTSSLPWERDPIAMPCSCRKFRPALWTIEHMILGRDLSLRVTFRNWGTEGFHIDPDWPLRLWVGSVDTGWRATLWVSPYTDRLCVHLTHPHQQLSQVVWETS